MDPSPGADDLWQIRFTHLDGGVLRCQNMLGLTFYLSPAGSAWREGQVTVPSSPDDARR